MFNSDSKQQAIFFLETSAKKCKDLQTRIVSAASDLHGLRVQTSDAILKSAEDYLTGLANSPKNLEKSVSEYRVARSEFESSVQQVAATSSQTTATAGSAGVAAIGLGIAASTLAPAAAIGVATTFGTASTGTAIAALSGAAEINAAIAWLGGGAIAAGGGGMAAGAEVLAILGGPIAWAIGGAALLGTGIWTSQKNAEIAERANQEALKIQETVRTLERAGVEINRLSALTNEHAEGARMQLTALTANSPKNYENFRDGDKEELGSLINNLNALARLLNTQVA